MSDLQFMSVAELAARLSVTHRTAGRLCERGEFPHARKLGKGRNSAYVIPLADVIAYEKKVALASKEAKAT